MLPSVSRQALWLSRVALIFSLIVLAMGCYTRLSDAGLGCPDWPGCFGHVLVPSDQTIVLSKIPGGMEVDVPKAWTEMIHRYLAGTLGLLIVALAFVLWRDGRRIGLHRAVPFLLLGLLLFQALLGMWTVTWQLLPLVVMGHLLGGMSLFAFLSYLSFRLRGPEPPIFESQALVRRAQIFVSILLLMLFVQIGLGGWMSANYASASCPGLPGCTRDMFWPSQGFSQAFRFWAPVGPNYQYGLLEGQARMQIHMMHRAWACVLTLALLAFCRFAWQYLPRTLRPRLRSLLGILLLQWLLGLSNVFWGVPTGVAVAHHLTAAGLVLHLVLLYPRLWPQR